MTDDPNTAVELTSAANAIESAAIVAALRAEGIETVTTGEFTAGFLAEAPGNVQIVVKSCDLARAQELLQRFKEDSSSIDWSKIDVGEPEDTES